MFGSCFATQYFILLIAVPWVDLQCLVAVILANVLLVL